MFSYIAGIDEAGRGPVLGPLVICCAFCKRNKEKQLGKIAFRDSKGFSDSQRRKIYEKLKEICNFRFVEISAADINRLMGEMSLNDIEAMFIADLLKKLENADVMIDMPDRYSWVFRKRMEKFGIKRFEAEHKADEKYPIVAAASICAKVVRDDKIARIREATLDFGSGYPCDRKTIAALKDRESYAKLKPFVRTRWKTLDTVKQRKLFEE
ncbi:ribonuclease HII [Candidatus Micrarchaeota archaeon]|nr:ribonuclease HII [Candidatus Micrarchaeota archaeon]